MESVFFSTKSPHIYAHRGGPLRSLDQNNTFPENTLLAFNDSANYTNHFEFDIWLTKDQIPVVHHDLNLSRMCDLNKNIHDLTLSELKALDPGKNTNYKGKGIKIPTLEEVTTSFKNSFFTVEIKHLYENASKQVLQVLEKTNCLDHCLLASEDHMVMTQIRSTFPDFVPTSMSLTDGQEFFAWVQTGCTTDYKPKASAIQAPIEINGLRLDQKIVIQAAHAAGMQMHFWTINQQSEMERLLNLGADAIITDDPQLGSKVLKDFSSKHTAKQ